jgi:hypothetical protein
MELGDDGKGVFGILFHIAHKLHHESVLLPIAGFGLTAGCVAAGLLVVRRRRLDTQLSFWPALVLVGGIFLTPRVNYYDLCLAFPLVFCIAFQNMAKWKTLLIYLALFLPSLAFMIRGRDTAWNGGLEGIFILMMLMVLLGQVIGAQYSRRAPVLLST